MLIIILINVLIYCGFFGTAITSMDNNSSVIMTLRHNNRKYQQKQQPIDSESEKGLLKTASILTSSSETILNENLLTIRNSIVTKNNNNNSKNNNNYYYNHKINNINMKNKNNNIFSNRMKMISNSNISSNNIKLNNVNNKKITIMSMPQNIIKIISIVTGSGGMRGSNKINDDTISANNKVLIKDYGGGNNNNNIIYDSGSSSIDNDDNIKIRGTRDVNNTDINEIGWTNINEEVDLTIPLVLSHLQELGMTYFKLPDMEETITLKPLFITYSAGLLLYNGSFYNIEGIYRNGDAMMTYHDKAFQFRLNLIIKKLQFDYDFIVKVMGLSATGTVVGTLEDLLITGDFSIDIRDPIIQLNDFQIIKFGNIIVQLNHNRIVQELSGIILTPITNLFRDRITTGITDDMKEQLNEIIGEFSQKDQLGIRKFMTQILSSITRNKRE